VGGKIKENNFVEIFPFRGVIFLLSREKLLLERRKIKI
jgi:hypothetical protein